METPNAVEVDERRAVSNDQHASCSALALGNGSELLLEVLDIVIDRVEAMRTGLDEELVERHVERVCSGGTGQAAGAHFVNDEQEPRAPRQLLGGLSRTASRFPERIHQLDIELGRAQDLPNSVLPDVRCESTRLIADRVGCHRDDCAVRSE